MASNGIAAILLGQARKRRATARPTKALIEAGLVESGLRNLPYGDRDSVGVLQQRASQGWKNAMNPAGAADDFLTQAIALNAKGFKGSAGALAQAVQRSAYPGRYDQRGTDAQRIIESMGGQPAEDRPRAKAATFQAAEDPGVAQGVASLLAQQSQPEPYRPPITAPEAPAGPAMAAPDVPQTVTPVLGAQDDQQKQLLAGLSDLMSQEASQTTLSGDKPAGAAPSPGGSKGKGLSPLLELFWQGEGGINVKNGKVVPQGFVKGHADHVHAAAGPKTVRKLGALAERMGLRVGENPAYGGVDPVHTPTSYHYKNQAIDVSGGTAAQMRKYAAAVARLYGLA